MREKEQIWLNTHPEVTKKYRGEYIAIIGEKIVAHGKKLAEVIRQAEKIESKPLISKVPQAEVLVV
jgi:hypothetical protein